MPRLKQRNGSNNHSRSYSESVDAYKANISQKSHQAKKIEAELKTAELRRQYRRARRNVIPAGLVRELSQGHRNSFKGTKEAKKSPLAIPSFILQSYANSQTVSFNSRDKFFTTRDDTTVKSIRFDSSMRLDDLQKPSSLTSIKPLYQTKSRKSGPTNSIRMARFKDEISESHINSLKIKRHDYHEILNCLAICYTFQIIEVSSRVADRDWSGSDLPYVEDIADFIFVGGYGNIDGVTECNNINLAARKYKNIEINNDEAVQALSHMYSMSHLLDGVTNKERKDSKRVPYHIVSDDDSENSESYGLHSE